MVHYFTKVGSGEYYLEELEDEPCPFVSKEFSKVYHLEELDNEPCPFLSK